MADRSKHFPTETAAMRMPTFSSAPRSEKSFTIGLWLVILFAAAEVIVAGYHYLGLGRMRVARTEPAVVPSNVLIPPPSAPPLTLATPGPAASPVTVLSEPDRLLKDAMA